LPNYSGQRCELFDMVGVCANASCDHGSCLINASTSEAYCNCFSQYSGVRCETASEQLKSVQVVKPVYMNEVGHVQMRCIVPEKMSNENALNMISMKIISGSRKHDDGATQQ
jgi:hypothetical protein